MTTRFDAQLRQHLLESANERPADGQLEAVVDAVARTRQRPRLVARLPWSSGHLGRVPAAAIRYGLIAVALVLAMVAGALLAGGGGSGQRTVFEGSWTAVDPGDGSGLTLVVGAGTKPEVHFEDGYASGAACVADAVKRFTADGTAAISGDRLVATFPDGGGCGTMTVGVRGDYDYVAGSDTLVDQDGVVWSRALAEGRATDAPPTAPQETQPVATAEPTFATPEPTVACLDLAGGDTYTGSAGDVELTATLPAQAVGSWHGWSDSFGLTNSCLTGRPISIGAAAVTTPTEQPARACQRGVGTVVASFEDAVASLSAANGRGISEPAELSIGGHVAVRYDVANLSGCPDGFGLVGGVILGPNESGSIYVIDVDGLLISLELNASEGATAADLDEARRIVESLEFAR